MVLAAWLLSYFRWVVWRRAMAVYVSNENCKEAPHRTWISKNETPQENSLEMVRSVDYSFRWYRQLSGYYSQQIDSGCNRILVFETPTRRLLSLHKCSIVECVQGLNHQREIGGITYNHITRQWIWQGTKYYRKDINYTTYVDRPFHWRMARDLRI